MYLIRRVISQFKANLRVSERDHSERVPKSYLEKRLQRVFADKKPPAGTGAKHYMKVGVYTKNFEKNSPGHAMITVIAVSPNGTKVKKHFSMWPKHDKVHPGTLFLPLPATVITDKTEDMEREGDERGPRKPDRTIRVTLSPEQHQEMHTQIKKLKREIHSGNRSYQLLTSLSLPARVIAAIWGSKAGHRSCRTCPFSGIAVERLDAKPTDTSYMSSNCSTSIADIIRAVGFRIERRLLLPLTPDALGDRIANLPGAQVKHNDTRSEPLDKEATDRAIKKRVGRLLEQDF